LGRITGAAASRTNDNCALHPPRLLDDLIDLLHRRLALLQHKSNVNLFLLQYLSHELHLPTTFRPSMNHHRHRTKRRPELGQALELAAAKKNSARRIEFKQDHCQRIPPCASPPRAAGSASRRLFPSIADNAAFAGASRNRPCSCTPQTDAVDWDRPLSERRHSGCCPARAGGCCGRCRG